MKEKMLNAAQKANALLTSIPATLVGGAFLILSFVLSKTGHAPLVDPAWITVIISGLPLVYLAIKRTINNRGIAKISSAHLISVAMIAAIATGDLFAAGEVAFIMAIGEILEDLTTDRAKRGLKKLISLAPSQARVINADGSLTLVSADTIKKGDVLRILPGESIPADGVVISGETSVDQSILTGESLPVDKAVGDSVYCGTINRFGAIDVRATEVGADSSLQKLIRMVREAEDKKAPAARVADAAASWLVPAALVIAVATGIITKDVVRAVTVLVVFCPCALVLATPTAIMAAIGQATKHGVIIKSGEALEKMGKTDVVAFDKTGTVTHGKLEVCDVVPLAREVDENLLLLVAASAEAKSEHPLAVAIADSAQKHGIKPATCENFRMSAGKGVCATVGEDVIVCGNEKHLSENGIEICTALKNALDSLRGAGKGSICVAHNGKVIGAIGFSDVVRREARQTVDELAKLGMKTVLLTGDNLGAAKRVADDVGIDDVHAELLPEQKLEHISELQSRGKTVCMIGDGINDAPALKTADVGIAMGDIGSDVAVEAADIALMSDDVSRLPYLKRLSRATLGTIKLSITLSMVINVVAVALSVAGVLTPTTGALVHNLGSFFVILIAALLYDRKFDRRSLT